MALTLPAVSACSVHVRTDGRRKAEGEPRFNSQLPLGRGSSIPWLRPRLPALPQRKKTSKSPGSDGASPVSVETAKSGTEKGGTRVRAKEKKPQKNRKQKTRKEVEKVDAIGRADVTDASFVPPPRNQLLFQAHVSKLQNNYGNTAITEVFRETG